MITYEEAVNSKQVLYQKLKELRELTEHTRDYNTKMNLKDQCKILRDMYRDACYQVERLRPIQEKKYKKTPVSKINTGAVTWDFFERSGSAWSDIEGHTWTELTEVVESVDEKNFLISVIKKAMYVLTDKQREYISLYEAGYAQIEIAEKYGVERSSVSRTIQRGMKRLENYIIASLQARACTSENGFDFLRFAETTNILTERMREYLFLLLTYDAKKIEMAEYLNVNRGSLYVSEKRIENNLSHIEPGVPRPPTNGNIVSKAEWKNIPEKEIAVRLAISPAAYYRWVCRDEYIDGIPRIAYEVLRLNHLTPREAGEQIGMSSESIKKYRQKYKDIDISKMKEPEPYIPRKKQSVDIRRLILESRRDTYVSP